MSEMRLQVLLSKAGVASRRAAEKLITEGRVTVNGEVVTELGSRADPEKDVVLLDGEVVGPSQEPAIIAMHKPVQVVTTLDDPEGRETVADLTGEEPFRFVPVGRLDYLTEGLLLLSTDGELTNRLLHPKYHVPKVYMVKVRGHVTKEGLDRLREGVELEDGKTQPAVVEWVAQASRHTWLEIVVTEGRNRLVRRMCDAIGHTALRVVRTEMGTIRLEGLRPGQYRYLQPHEIRGLYKVAKLKAPAQSTERAEQTGFMPLGKARRGKGPLPARDMPPGALQTHTTRRERRLQREGVEEAQRKKRGPQPEARRGQGGAGWAPRGEDADDAPRTRGPRDRRGGSRDQGEGPSSGWSSRGQDRERGARDEARGGDRGGWRGGRSEDRGRDERGGRDEDRGGYGRGRADRRDGGRSQGRGTDDRRGGHIGARDDRRPQRGGDDRRDERGGDRRERDDRRDERGGYWRERDDRRDERGGDRRDRDDRRGGRDEHRQQAGRGGDDRRGGRSDRQGYGRGADDRRGARDDRGSERRGGYDRYARDDSGSYRRERDDRGYGRDDRGGRDDGPRASRGGDRRGGYGRDDRGGYGRRDDDRRTSGRDDRRDDRGGRAVGRGYSTGGARGARSQDDRREGRARDDARGFDEGPRGRGRGGPRGRGGSRASGRASGRAGGRGGATKGGPRASGRKPKRGR